MTTRVGLAIGRHLLVAAEIRPGRGPARLGRVWRRPLDSEPGERGWPEVSAALRDLLADLGTARGEAAVALLPPLARVKALWLPRLRRRDLRALVARAARRYFAAAGDRVVVDVVPTDERGRNGLRRCLAACAPVTVIDAVSAAVAESGLACQTITVAAPAGVTALGALAPETRRGPCVVVLEAEGWREGVAVRRGEPWVLEPWDWASEERVPELIAKLATAAFGRETPVVRPGAAPNHGAGAAHTVLGEVNAGALAAWGATLVNGRHPLLLPDDLRIARERGAARAGVRLAVAALALLGLAAAVYLGGLRREVRAVAAARRDVAEDVRLTLASRQLAADLGDRLATLRALEARPQWTPRVLALALALPDSTHLTAVVADGSALRVQGIAPSAAAAVRALQASERLPEVRLLTSVRAEGGRDVERFDVVLGGDSTAGRSRSAGFQ